MKFYLELYCDGIRVRLVSGQADTNLRKHGITFKFTTRVFEDPNRTEGLDDRDYQDEQRWVTTGQAAEFVLTVVFTLRKEAIRLISARRATRRKLYDY